MHGSRRIASRPGALDMRMLRRAVRRSPLENSRCALPGRIVPGRALRIAWCKRQVALCDAGERAGLRTGPLARKPCRTAFLSAEIPLPDPRVLSKWMVNDAAGCVTKVSDRANSGRSGGASKSLLSGPWNTRHHRFERTCTGCCNCLAAIAS